jgi:hypothetical protein
MAEPVIEPVTPPVVAPVAPPEWVAEFAKLRTEVETLRGERHTRQAGERDVEEKKLKDKGEYETLIRQRDDKIKTLTDTQTAREHRYRESARDQALTEALAATGLSLTKGASTQLLKLWRDDFEVVEASDGSIKVQTKDWKTPAQVVKERLATEDYANFVLAGSKGGSGGGGGNRPNATALDPDKPLSLLEKIVARKAAEAAKASPGGRPIGLRSSGGSA